MKKLMKFLAYCLFFIIALIYFAPKISAYYFLESQIKPFGVIVSGEDLRDNGFSLEIENADISFKAIESAKIKEIHVKIYGVYNGVSFEDISLSSTVASFIPLHVTSASVTHTIIDPLNVHAFIEGEFGEAEATYDILANGVKVTLKPSDIMLKKYKSTLRSLSKNGNGEYVYEKTF